MKKRHPKKMTKRQNRQLSILYFIFVLLFTALGVRIFYIQQTKGEEYTEKSSLQQNFTNVTIPYRRGNITDRNGMMLATSEKVYNVIFDCKVINSDDSYKQPSIEALCQCFPELDAQVLYQTLTDKPASSYEVLAKQKTYEEVKPLMDILEDDENYPAVKGVWLEEEYKRFYPYETLACDLIGFVNRGDVGNYGIEEYYNEELNGTNGRKYQYIDTNGEQETVVKNAEDGYNIVSTIDYNIQSVVEKYIKQFNEAHINEAREGRGAEEIAVIVQNPNTGEILAEANYPVFDLNAPKDVSKSGIITAQALTAEEVNALDDNLKSKLMQPIWRNFCLTDSFEPGSTKKPFTVAAGLETGKLNGDEHFVCDGVEAVADHNIHCVVRSGHGDQTVSQAIMNSCNDVLMQIANRIGVETFIRYQNVWGFGKKTNIDLPAEANCANLIYTFDTMHETELATCSFGQGFNVTMTQMMSAFCSLINGGNYYQPHVVKKITDADGATIKNIEPTLVRKTISKETSEKVKTYLKDTVMEGTGNLALVEGYTMGGKTGTAERLPRGNRQYVVSFIGYAPADNPEIAIYVVIDRPNVEDQAHSSFAQEIAKNVLTEVLPYLNIFPEAKEVEEGVTEDNASEPPVTDEQIDEGSVFEEGQEFPVLNQ